MDVERATVKSVSLSLLCTFGEEKGMVGELPFKYSAWLEVNPNDYVARKSLEMELCPTTPPIKPN